MGRRRRSRPFRGLERAVAAGDAVAFYGLLDQQTRWAIESTLQGSAAAAHHHHGQVSRGRGAKGAGPAAPRPRRADAAQLLQAHQRRSSRRRGVPQAARLGVGADQEQDRRPPTRSGSRAPGRHAVPLRQEQRRHLGLVASCAATGRCEKDRASTRSRPCRTTPSSIRRRRQTMSPSQAHRIAVIPGDGIGVEVTTEAVKVLRAVAPALTQPVELADFDWGAERWLRDGTTLPEGGDGRSARPLRGHPVRRARRSARARAGARARHPARAALPARPVHQPAAGQAPRRAADAAQGQDGSPTSTCWCSARTPRGSTPASAATSRRARADEIAINEDVNTRKGVERILRAAFEAARGAAQEAVHERQGQRADLRARAVAALLRRAEEGVRRRRGVAPVRRRGGDGDGARARALRRAGDLEHVRRHPDRSRRGHRRRAGAGGVGEHPSRALLAVRAGARLGARHRGQGRGQSARRHLVDGDDARAPGRDRRRRRACRRRWRAW